VQSSCGGGGASQSDAADLSDTSAQIGRPGASISHCVMQFRGFCHAKSHSDIVSKRGETNFPN
jgi:hypothetical protein